MQEHVSTLVGHLIALAALSMSKFSTISSSSMAPFKSCLLASLCIHYKNLDEICIDDTMQFINILDHHYMHIKGLICFSYVYKQKSAET